jgi:hypothetical protein
MPLGPIARWPQSLKTAIAIMVGSGHATQLTSGPDRTVLYNDAMRLPLAYAIHGTRSRFPESVARRL